VRSFRKLATRWPISSACIASLILPMVSAVLIPAPALAQAGIIQVAVVDFRNTSKISNEMFGTMATDAVVVELLRSGKFGVTRADELQKAMEELGYKSKEDRVPKVIVTPAMMVRLGQMVVADSVVTGEVTSIKVDGNKKAEARVTVRMLDVASGVWTNGAVATGTSNPRIGYTADKDTDLIVEAINNAARQAVESMVSYIIPEATIIGTFGADEVLLNKGAQEGVQNGMEMIVLRRGETGLDEVVGRIKVTNASDTDARARAITTTRGLKPEDRVRAVFELPRDTGERTTTARVDTQKKIAKGTSMLWGLVALVGLATLFKGGGDKGESVPGAVAVAGASPDVTSGFDQGGIMLLWKDPKPLRHADIIEYHVWRDDHGTYFTTGGAMTNAGPVLAPDQTTATALTTPLGSYDHHSIDSTAPRQPLSYTYASQDHTSLDTASADPMPGIVTGKTHQYWVSCLYTRRTSGSDGAEIVTYWETDPVSAGRATYLLRPAPESPGGSTAQDYEDLTNIVFQWRGSSGADQYVIEISTTPDFKRNETWVNVIYQPTSQDGQLFSKTYTNVLKNADTGQIVTELANVQPGGTLFWRVGARNRADKPGPYPAGPSPLLSGAKNTRYIYSDQSMVYMFMTLPDMPDPPPDDGSGGGTDDGTTPPPPPPL
jgi:hypothetical protein